jgi:hypothetical protein
VKKHNCRSTATSWGVIVTRGNSDLDGCGEKEQSREKKDIVLMHS